MDWRSINLHGAARIARVAGVYELCDMRGVPWTKYKVKVLEEQAGRFLAILNVSTRDANGNPDGIAGLGCSEPEALEDAIARFSEVLSCRSDWGQEDFEWADPHDF